MDIRFQLAFTESHPKKEANDVTVLPTYYNNLDFSFTFLEAIFYYIQHQKSHSDFEKKINLVQFTDLIKKSYNF